MASFKAGSTTRRPIATDLGLASFRIHAKLLIPLNPHPYAHKPRVGDPVGEMSEWLKEHAWKACVGETLPWVRIPLSPPNFFTPPKKGEFPGILRVRKLNHLADPVPTNQARIA